MLAEKKVKNQKVFGEKQQIEVSQKTMSDKQMTKQKYPAQQGFARNPKQNSGVRKIESKNK